MLMRCLVMLLGALLVTSAQAKDWTYGGKIVSCEKAVKYRDTELFMSYVTAIDNFDADREARAKKVIQGMEAHLPALLKELDSQDKILAKRVVTVVAGLTMAEIGRYMAVKGKPNISDIEKKTLQALAERSAAWQTFFLKLGTDKGFQPGATDVLQVPIGFAASFFPVAGWTFTYGTATIDIAAAIGEHHIAKKDVEVSAEMLRAGIKQITEKLRMPKIAELNVIKTSIDTQCGVPEKPTPTKS